MGLFGSIGIGGEIRNLGIEDVNVRGRDYVGGLCGENYCGTIMNCYVMVSVNGDYALGGLCGRNYEGTITNCYATGWITGDYDLGGLCGRNYGTITGCFATGAIGSGQGYLGGLCGYNDGTIINCYAMGDVNGGDDGYRIGGLCGFNNDMITHCYATGVVTGRTYVGGLCGRNYYGTIVSCFWDVESSGLSVSEGGVGLTTYEMTYANSFLDAGWDFVGETINGPNDIWTIKEGVDYPQFVWPLVNLVGWYKVDGLDFAYFASRWGDENCGDSNDCDGVDFDFSGVVDWGDFRIFCDHWLAGAF